MSGRQAKILSAADLTDLLVFASVRIERIDRIGLELGTKGKSYLHVEEDDLLSAVAELRRRWTMSRDAWQIRIETQMRLSCNAMSSCCREVYVRGKARTKSVAANGIALFLEISYEPNNEHDAEELSSASVTMSFVIVRGVTSLRYSPP